ncbi:hypothetical protein [Marinifilum sp.]|uniref:hypothetical protein n=1 Tax=Marinifilum sp. TaxID=2033137 RepID=UPI003BAD5490
MKYSYSIHNDNINDVGAEAEVLLKSDKNLNNQISNHMKNKLACMTSRYRYLGNFLLAEWDGIYTDNLFIKGTPISETVFGLNFILEGSWGMNIGKASNVCKAGTNFFLWS